MEFTIRRAEEADVPAIVEMLADDIHGARRERPGDAVYAEAFEEIDADPNYLVAVAERDGELVGTFALIFSRGLQNHGKVRMNIEAVRVRDGLRGTGLGSQMMRWAIDEARRRGAGVVRVVSHGDREGAHRFYERLGFEPSHVGFRLDL